jgi:hypothetical protein
MSTASGENRGFKVANQAPLLSLLERMTTQAEVVYTRDQLDLEIKALIESISDPELMKQIKSIEKTRDITEALSALQVKRSVDIWTIQKLIKLENHRSLIK